MVGGILLALLELPLLSEGSRFLVFVQFDRSIYKDLYKDLKIYKSRNAIVKKGDLALVLSVELFLLN